VKTFERIIFIAETEYKDKSFTDFEMSKKFGVSANLMAMWLHSLVRKGELNHTVKSSWNGSN